ncbi:RelB/StbD replicon stabilization protein (antitoxin to RelE/StbE) [uncultured Candidatus Thioglobus sp.]|nr:RelB/StbD replicon stabilization protein (antitoxin to RelE/StbE) [uncultured Candidatus Thioglobus sp.]
MAITISTADVRKDFSNIVNQVNYSQEQILLTRRGKEVAAIVSVEELKLLQKIENFLDIEDAQKALASHGDNIPAKEVWAQLGL